MAGRAGSGDKKFLKTLIWISLMTLLICSFLSFAYVANLFDDGNVEQTINISADDGIEIIVPSKSNTKDVANILNSKGIISYPFVFKLLSKVDGYDGQYKAGAHILSKELSYEEIMSILTSTPKTVAITIPEGYNFDQIVEVLVSQGFGTKEKFKEVAEKGIFNFSFLQSLPYRQNKLEGYLFPDTYYFDKSAEPKDILDTMLKNYEEKITPEFYQLAEKIGMNMDDIIILSSIVERESKIKSERKTIAGVFYNRLNSKDPALKKLQSCATIQYIIFKREGKVKENLTEKDVKINHPYNTYLREGLPPGPIASPGIESIEATLKPEKHDYYYFVAKGDGSHAFSRTLSEHNANIKRYLK